MDMIPCATVEINILCNSYIHLKHSDPYNDNINNRALLQLTFEAENS